MGTIFTSLSVSMSFHKAVLTKQLLQFSGSDTAATVLLRAMYMTHQST